MIRIFKLVLLLVVSQVALGQAPSNYTNINGRYRWIAGMFDSTFHIPKGTSPSLRTGGSTNAGGLFYNTSDSSVYTYTGTQWIKVRGSINPSDTTNKYVTQVYKKNGSDSVFYVKGGNHLWAFNDSTGSAGGGGGGKVYYFNGGVNMGTFGGFTMYELGDTANTGAAANFTRATTGAIANFITDPNKPGLLQIPAGSWTIDAWMSETGSGANHAQVWAVLEKWNGSTITTIATSPIEEITEGNSPNLYTWAISVPTTSLLVTDRIIIQFYITNTNGKTVTLYTQNGYVGEVHTTFTTGIGAINGLTAPAQYLVTGTSGTDFNISSVTATHTFNLPTASATNRGALSSADWTTFNSKLSPADTVSLSNRINLKLNISDTAAMLSPYARTNVVNAGLATKVNISDTATMLSPYARKNFLNAGTGISYSSTTGTIANTAPDQTVALNAGTGISISGTYPNFTITNSSPSSGGTVTSVGSNNGTGLTGGPITTSGTLAIDTLLVSTRAWRQKGIDSVQANLTAGLALKVNISDTASMLSPYLKSNTAAATYVPQTRTITINGTSQDLTANRTYNVGTVTSVGATAGTGISVSGSPITSSGSFTITNTAPDQTVTLSAGTGISIAGTYPSFTITNSSPSSGGTVTSVGSNTGTGLTGGPITGSGTLAIDTALISTRLWRQKGVDSVAALANTKVSSVSGTAPISSSGGTSPTISISQASGSTNGFLSSTDWTTFNNKQNALTNPVTGSGTTNYIPKFTSSSAIGNSNLINDASGNLGLGQAPNSTWIANSKAIQIKDWTSLSQRTDGAAVFGMNIVETSSNSYSYLQSFSAGRYQINGNEHTWYNAPSGTAGNAISFTQAMTLDASGRLGIGTTSPNAILHLAQNTTNLNLYLQNTNGSGQTWAVNSDNLGKFNIHNTSVNVLTISGTNVGIGTTNPSARLSIESSGTNRDVFNVGYSSSAFDMLQLYEYSGGNAELNLRNDASTGIVRLATNGNSFFNGGNVGIGTTNPGQKLVVQESGDVFLQLRNNTAGQNFFIGALSTETRLNNDNTTPTTFWNNGSERMRITSGGNVGIGTTSPTNILELARASANTQAILTESSDSGDDVALFYSRRSRGTSLSSPTAIQSANFMGGLAIGAYNSSAYAIGAKIYGIADQTWTTSAQGTNLVFATTSNGTTTVTERMRITSGGNVGINTQTPNATFHVNGSVAAAISIKTATYTLTSSDYTVVFDLNGNATANLPNATTCSGRIYVIKINRTNVSDVLTIDPNGAQTIDGNATYDLQCQQAITIQSDGSNWRIIGDYAAGLNCL